MLLRELSFGGILVSPMLVFVLASLLIAAVLRTALHRTGLTRWIWQEAWFDVSLFVIVLALVVRFSTLVS
ncbi:DUF1656 domain-containing protein [Kushneria aurantia]|uniref:DUF1656 domain-containing protein n=1 Tax=Kushneria aurantia TaxID=504092 RepID=A0ABV6FZW3_9GAMM|nr:DUF1656 domain-containing protein [Kushneria aurantia]